MPPRFFSSATSSVVDERYVVGLSRDIWETIADFLSEEDLKKLYSLTPAFLYRALKLRYQSLQVTKWADQSTCQTLEHVRAPLCAPFVRRLGVQFEGLRQYDTRNRRGITPMKISFPALVVGKMKRYTQDTVSYVSSIGEPPTPSLERTMDLLNETIPYLTHVEYFSVNCWDHPQEVKISPLLAVAWASIGSNLTTLEFHGNIDSYQYLSESRPFLPNLTTLELDTTLNISRTVRDVEHERLILRDHLAPFISALAAQLLSLRVFFFPTADLSELFDQISLQCFGKLKCLRLCLPFSGLFRDPKGLMAFLSPTTLPVVESLHLRLNPTGAGLDRSNEIPLAQFLTKLANYDPMPFVNLCTLEIFPTYLPEGCDVLYTAISRSSDTLRSVCVRDRSFQPDEFVELVCKLLQCKELRMLKLNLSKLDISVIDLLASSFPKLTRLTIAVDESRDLTEPSISPTLEADLAARDYTFWELKDVGFYRAGSQVDKCLMETFAMCVPSVTSFWGNGHKLSEEFVFRARPRTPPANGIAANARKFFCGCLSSRGFDG